MALNAASMYRVSCGVSNRGAQARCNLSRSRLAPSRAGSWPSSMARSSYCCGVAAMRSGMPAAESRLAGTRLAKVSPGQGSTPKHASRHGLQDTHPAGKSDRSDFVAVVEAAEYRRRLRQTKLPARKAGVGDGTLRIVHHEATGQIDDALGVELPRFLRHHHGIGHKVVDVGRAQGAGVAEIAHLQGRGASREN